MLKEAILTESLARIHAHLCGDGSLFFYKKKRYPADLKNHPRKKLDRLSWCVAYTNTEKTLRDEFVKDIKKTFNRKANECGPEIIVENAKWIYEILKYLGASDSYSWFIPKRLSNSNNKIIREWLRAFFDDEAHIDCIKKRIRVKSVNRKALFQVKKLLAKLGITSRITPLKGTYTDNSVYLNINGKDIKKYHKKIGFKHPKNLTRIKRLCSSLTPH